MDNIPEYRISGILEQKTQELLFERQLEEELEEQSTLTTLVCAFLPSLMHYSRNGIYD